MPITSDQVRAKAKAFVDALCKLPRSQYGAVPSVHFVTDYNRLRELALEVAPEIDRRLMPDALPLDKVSRTVAYVEIEAYARQILELLATEVADEPLPAPALERSDAGRQYDVETIRQEHSQAYRPWSEQDEAYLRQRFAEGARIPDLADELGRQPGGVRSRLRKLGLVDR